MILQYRQLVKRGFNVSAILFHDTANDVLVITHADSVGRRGYDFRVRLVSLSFSFTFALNFISS